jgi:hypothetical protein
MTKDWIIAALERELEREGTRSRFNAITRQSALSGASVLPTSRLEPLAPFPLASPARFSRSIQEPD